MKEDKALWEEIDLSKTKGNQMSKTCYKGFTYSISETEYSTTSSDCKEKQLTKLSQGPRPY